MPNYIETNYPVDVSLLKSYMNDQWEDSNELYKEYMSWENNKFFVQEIKDFDRPLLREIKNIWNHLGIRPREWRCNFFRVLPGGELPLHTDVLSKCSVVIPMTEMTGELYFEDGTEVLYNNMTVINTKVAHGVKAPIKERIVFHMGIHDVKFEEVTIGHDT
tara:strand:- start:349 stop:831 length:483 start_codon:yes stop_codon:yes gene_type:complete